MQSASPDSGRTRPTKGGNAAVIPRYTRPDMSRIWSDENRFRTWLTVEVAATETLAEAGMVPKDAAKAIRKRANFDLRRIHEIEAEVRHDVIAFTTAVAEIVGPEARWFHYGLTSNDVVDTAQALQIQQACRILLAGLERLRFTSPHPIGFRSDLIDSFGRLPKLVEHVHLPLQSGRRARSTSPSRLERPRPSDL